MGPRLSSKFTAVLIWSLILGFLIFPFAIPAKGQGIDSTPSQTSETPIQDAGSPSPSFTSTPASTPTEPAQAPQTATASSVGTTTPSNQPENLATATATVLLTGTPTGINTRTPTVIPPVNVPAGAYVNDEVLVKIRTRNPSAAFLSGLTGEGAQIKTRLSDLGVLVIKVPAGSVPDFIANIKTSPDVVYAEPDYLMSIADTIPNDSNWGLQYAPAAIRAPQGWDLSTGSSAVTIAVIDTGIDQSHPDLAGKIVPGYDFVNNDNNPQDDNGHGTHVAGIAAASANNGTGIAGISWGARLMPVKVLNASGNGSYAEAAAGIMWAADNGAQVMNISFGGSAPSTTLDDAIMYAHNKGVTIVAAAGNSGSNFVLYPARYPEVIAVAATDGSNARAGFSNYGPELSVSAPGVAIYSSLPGGAYGYLSGTSMSAPMVSGAAAILAGLPGNNNPAAITWELQSTALDLGAPGYDVLYGYGLIQLDAAIRLALPTSTATATITATAIFTPTSAVTAARTMTATAAAQPGPHARSATPAPVGQVFFPPPVAASLTASASPTPGISPGAPTGASLAGTTASGSPTPTLLVSGSSADVQAQDNNQDYSVWMPCLGILLIVVGLILARIIVVLQRKQE